MSCWCGHRPWHHWGYGYGPGPRRRRERVEDLAGYLQDLEDEAGQVREERERLRRSRGAEQA